MHCNLAVFIIMVLYWFTVIFLWGCCGKTIKKPGSTDFPCLFSSSSRLCLWSPCPSVKSSDVNTMNRHDGSQVGWDYLTYPKGNSHQIKKKKHNWKEKKHSLQTFCLSSSKTICFCFTASWAGQQKASGDLYCTRGGTGRRVLPPCQPAKHSCV